MEGINSSFASGIQALQIADTHLGQHAREIARAPTSVPDAAPLTDSLLGLQQAETYALSGLKVIQAADNVIGTLLDIEV